MNRIFSLLAFIIAVSACNNPSSLAERYLLNQTFYENTIGNPLLISTTEGDKTILTYFSYDKNGRCLGWDHKGANYLPCYSFSYSKDGVKTIHFSVSFSTSKYETTDTVIRVKRDSIVLKGDDVRVIAGNTIISQDHEGNIFSETTLNDYGQMIYLKNKYGETAFSYDKNHNLSDRKAVRTDGSDEGHYKYGYLDFDKKGNWTKKTVDDGTSRIDTITRIICYNAKDTAAFFKMSRSRNISLAEEFLNLKYPQFAPWTVSAASNTDSLATPFMNLTSLRLKYAYLNLDIAKAYLSPNPKATVRQLKAKEKQLFRAVLSSSDIHDNPRGPEKNVLGFEAEVKSAVSEKEYTAYFFLNRDNRTIGHCNLDNKKMLDELLESSLAVSKAAREYGVY